MVKAKRSFGPFSKAAAGVLALSAVMGALSAGSPVWAGSSQAEIRQRQQVLENSAAATDQRDKQAQDTAERQKQLLMYQVRKNARTNQKTQCQLAGQSNC